MSQNRLPGPQKGLSCRMKGICRNTSHRRLRHSLPCLSFSRGLFTVSGLPAVNIGDIRIEGAGSPAKAFLVDFPTVDFGGNAFRFVPVFGYTVQNIVCSVMVNHAPECCNHHRTTRLHHIGSAICRRYCCPVFGSLASGHTTALNRQTP